MDSISLKGLPLVGKGAHGRVYKLDEYRCIKICKNAKDMQMEYRVLKKVEGYPQFPRVYECEDRYMIREYIAGPNIVDYIKHNGLDSYLARELTELIIVFISLGFTRIDIRMGEVFVTGGGRIRIIDTTRYMDKRASYPRKMLKTLKGLGYYNQYMSFLKQNYPRFYISWNR